MADPKSAIPTISVNKALAQWRMVPEAEIDCGGFKAVLRFFGATNQLVHSEVAKRQSQTALTGATDPALLSDEDFKLDVESWCRISLVSWDMMSDPVLGPRGKVIQEPQPVPVELAPDIYCGHGMGGKELYFAMFKASQERDRFVITDKDEAKAEKNLPK